MDGKPLNEAPPVISHFAGSQFNRLKWFLFCLPLLGLPAAMGFLIPYSVGRGFLSQAYEFDDLFAFALPFAISALFAFLASCAWVKRVGIWLATFVIQFALLFNLTPGGFKAELRGMADRCKQEYPVDKIRSVGAALLNENQDGTLRLIRPKKTDQYGSWGHELIVDALQLPMDFQWKFPHVRVSTNGADVQIVFEIAGDRALIYSTNRLNESPWFYPVGKNIYICRYARP